MKLHEIFVESGEDESADEEPKSAEFKSLEEQMRKVKIMYPTEHDWTTAWGPERVMAPDGELLPKIHSLSFIAKMSGVEFMWPFKKNANLRDVSFGQVYGKTNWLTIPNLELSTGIRELSLGCIVKSLKGLEQIHALEEIKFSYYFEMNGGGLLPLLKVPKSVKFINHTDTETNMYKALKIIIKHRSRDVAEVADCMDELIEAGLKEYAKL
jgi:hypothetical protein